jgi:hypothetical protein
VRQGEPLDVQECIEGSNRHLIKEGGANLGFVPGDALAEAFKQQEQAARFKESGQMTSS